MNDILSAIIKKRKQDIEKLGINFAFDLPEKRQRPLHNFLKGKGVILEVKRASPSKGDISPELDAAQTARSYAQAGAAAISCLTEGNYFKGSLKDLMTVCQSLDQLAAKTKDPLPAVLRKDFLLFPEEIEVSYRAGADAVLLIARILDTKTIVKMAKEAAVRGMTSLVEVRSSQDLDKLKALLEAVDSSYIVCGVNSRDLASFKIDLLRPLLMLREIKNIMGEDARIVFESGVYTCEAARVIGSLGFDGLLLGEAAARNPEIRKELVTSFTTSTSTKNSAFWTDYALKEASSKKTLAKICGLTRIEDALAAEKSGAVFLGFIFAAAFPRSLSRENRLEKLLTEFDRLNAKKIAVIVDLESKEAKAAINYVKHGIFDALQFHKIPYEAVSPELLSLPHFFACDSLEEYQKLVSKGELRVLLDSRKLIKPKPEAPGLTSSGCYEVKWIAGGITGENVKQVLEQYQPELIDISGGIEDETAGIKNHNKLEKLMEEL